MRVILWVEVVLTTVVTVSGHKSLWPWPRVGGMRNPRCISCTEVKEAHLCENCCEVNVCQPNPCKNNGTCSSVNKGYNCNCATGYLGQHCDVNPCDVYNPCLNNGRCYPSEFVVNCSCPLGFIGAFCQVNPCDVNNPCLNNGTCYPSEFVVNCSCPLGFIGAYCEDDSCNPNPCTDGATCVRVDGGFECRCIIVNDRTITSPNYPQNYPGDFDKCYLIIGRPGQNITLTLGAQFSIEILLECGGRLSSGKYCKYDYLTLQGVRYCGGVLPGPIIVPTGENTNVRFVSDWAFHCTGFNLSITYTGTTCCIVFLYK